MQTEPHEQQATQTSKLAFCRYGLPANQRGFDVPLPGFLHVSCPHFYRYGRAGETEEQFADRLARELDDLIIQEGPETVAAFYGEPLMGAGGGDHSAEDLLGKDPEGVPQA